MNDISGFDLKEGRFQADFYFWIKWSEENVLLDVKNPPFSFTNGEIGSIDLISTESDGPWKSVRWRIQGVFRGSFPLNKFPFDTQTLPIELEIPSTLGELKPDLTGSGMNQGFSITGWIYEPYFKAKIKDKTYESDLGSVEIEGEKYSSDSVQFLVTLKRPFFSYIIKLFFPLAIIITMATIALLIVPDDIEARAGMIITALLTCVALNLSLSDSIPDVPYTVVADHFFIGAYIIILMTLIHTIIMYKMNQKKNENVVNYDLQAQRFMPALAVTVFAIISIFAFIKEKEEFIIEEIPVNEASGRPVSAKKEITINYISMKSLTTYGIMDNFLARGMYHPQKNRSLPYLNVQIPAMTNEFVRFLPNGEMRIRWKLRPDMVWSNGQTITSKDVAFSIDFDEDPYRKSVEIVDDETVDVYYTKRLFSKIDSFRVIPEKNLREVFKKEGANGVYAALKTENIPLNGPYKLEKFESGKEMIFVRNPEFRGNPPLIEKVILRNSDKVEGRKIHNYAGEDILAGYYDVAPAVSSLSAKHAMGQKGLTVITNPEKFFYYLRMGVANYPFNKIEVRKALVYAIDRERIMKVYDSINGEVSNSYRSRSSDDFSWNTEKYYHSPAKSKELLRSAGLTLPVKITFFRNKPSTSLNSPLDKTTKYIIDDLNNAGFKLDVKIVKSTFKETYGGKSEGIAIVYTRSTDPINFWNLPEENDNLVTDKPFGAFDEEAVNLFEKYRTNMFEERSRLLSQQMQDAFSRKLPLIPLFHAARYTVFRSNLKGLDPKPGAYWWNIEDIYFEEEK
ncbi:MAG: ABC transporter substrate-binding protein [Spirochaetia bacterium]|nr:ABC transporter substrate-binding protein [Spirochaetia bacterium]